MQYKDIPKFKRSHYHITIPFVYVLETLERWERDQLESGFKFELNPIFQRGHVWTEDQQIKYIEWILRDGESGRDIYFNHPAWDNSYKADMVCVDGLQRLTAIKRFLHNEIKAFDMYYRDMGKISNNNVLNFHVGSFTEKEAIEWYLEMNFTGTPHTEEELNRVKSLLNTDY